MKINKILLHIVTSQVRTKSVYYLNSVVLFTINMTIKILKREFLAKPYQRFILFYHVSLSMVNRFISPNTCFYCDVLPYIMFIIEQRINMNWITEIDIFNITLPSYENTSCAKRNSPKICTSRDLKNSSSDKQLIYWGSGLKYNLFKRNIRLLYNL